MIECHTHCSHSADSPTDIREMIEKAIALGTSYIAFTDHCDRDYLYNDSPDCGIRQIDINSHIKEVLEYREEYKDRIYVALGIELGFTEEAQKDYSNIIESCNEWDIILNSVHSVQGIDCYRPEFFDNLTKSEGYNKYLLAVLDSVKANYSFDVISHLGYVTRRAPFADKTLNYSEHKEIIDEILKAIINKGLSLELNTHAKSAGLTFLPNIDIIKRYIQLGGEEFTFGTDAHRVDRLGDSYNEVVDVMKSLGINYFNIYKKRKIEKVKI